MIFSEISGDSEVVEQITCPCLAELTQTDPPYTVQTLRPRQKGRGVLESVGEEREREGEIETGKKEREGERERDEG